MNLIHKSIKYVSRKQVQIPFEGTMKSVLKKGDKFTKGTELFSVEKSSLLESYFLPNELGIKVGELQKYIRRIEGEYVSKGDVIAERLVSGGLKSKRVISESEGIVDFSKLNLGYLNIVSETAAQKFESSFKGEIKEVNFGKGITIETDVCQMPFMYANTEIATKYFNGFQSTFGEFLVLNDGMSVGSTKHLPDSLENKIVFAGRFLYPELAVELFRRGCKFVLVGSMDFNDLNNLELPVGVMTGFGNMYVDSTVLFAFKQLEGFQVSVSTELGLVQFLVGLNDKISQLFQQEYYVESIKKGNIVRSKEVESYGLVGEVISIEDDGNYALVAMQEGSQVLIDMENLELYNEEFSLMRTRIV
jgi:hypothetical protein